MPHSGPIRDPATPARAPPSGLLSRQLGGGAVITEGVLMPPPTMFPPLRASLGAVDGDVPPIGEVVAVVLVMRSHGARIVALIETAALGSTVERVPRRTVDSLDATAVTRSVRGVSVPLRVARLT